MIKSTLFITTLLVSGMTFAGSYTNASYDQSTLVLTEKHLKNDFSAKESVSAESGKADRLGSWIVALGEVEDQYHKDLENLITSTPKKGRAYAKITDSQGTTVQYVGQAVSQSERFVASASRSSNRNAYDIMIESIADRHGVARGLVKAIMHTESSFNPYARSHVGAQGLMQLMPATARRFNVENSYDPQQNIEGGVKYIKWLMKRFDGNISYVLAAYNAGEGNVDKYSGIPPFKETQNYVKKVLERYHSLYKHI